MKKNTTAKLLAAFCMLLLNISLKSQTNITIGDMNTAYISEKYPFDNYYNYSWSNVIYLSSEIGQGGKITQIAFYVYQGNTISMASQKILMRETSATGYTSSTYPGETGFTTVFNGTISYNFSGTSGWQVITLSTPFTYSGTNNLEVLFENNSGAYTNNFEYFYTTTGYSSNRVRRDFNDASFPSSCVNCGAFANIPNTQLTMVCSSTVSISPSSPSVCNGSGTTLTASGASSYSWSPAASLSSGTGSSVIASPGSTTNYTVTAQDASACVQTKTVTVTVNALPTISISPSSPSICSGGSTTLTASGASTYSWSPTTNLSASTGASVIANPSSTTTYTVTGTGSNGCTKSQTVVVTVNSPSAITFNPTAPAVCIGSTTTITASGASTYSWSPATNLNTTTGATVAANPTTTTTYSVNYTSSNGCAGTTTLSVAVNPLPTLTLSPSSPAVCNGSTTTLTASGASTYSWSPATNLSATTGASVNANPTTATNYTLTGTNANGCINTKAFTVNVNGLPTLAVSPTSASICVGNNTSLTASGASTYSWTPSSSLNNANAASVTASPNTTTTYTVSGTNANGCVGTATVTVNVNSLPTINVTASPTAICVGASSNLIASGATTYSWSPATGLNNTNTANVTANPNATTAYTVSGTNANGCIGNQTISLVVNPLPSISISPSSPIVLGGKGATITANGASTYSWSPSTNLSSTSGSTVTANPQITTAYTLTGTSAAGCVNQTAFSVGIELWQQVADSAKAPIFYQGNVGINNPNPQAALDVVGNEKLSGNLTVGGTITDPSFGGSGNRILQTDNAGVITPISSGTSAQVLYGNGTWGALPAQPIQTSGTNAYFTGGNFGIGNPSPSFPLDVTGNARISGNLTVGGINATGSNLDVTTPAVFTNSVTLSGLANGTGNQRLSINAGGNIVAGGATTTWDLAGNAGTDEGVTNFLGTTDDKDIIFKTNNTERMRITSHSTNQYEQGRVYIGGGELLTTNNDLGGNWDDKLVVKDAIRVVSDNLVPSKCALLGNDGAHTYLESFKQLGTDQPPYTSPDDILIGYYSGANVTIAQDPNLGTTGGYLGVQRTLTVGNDIGIGSDATNSSSQLYLRGTGDHNHGLGWFSTFPITNNNTSVSVDGPVLYGYGGGALATKQAISGQPTTTNIALNWLANGRVGIGTAAPDALLHVSTQNTPNIPGLIVDNGYPVSGPAEFQVNSNGTTVINAIAVTNQDIFDINFQESQGGTNEATLNFFKTIFDGTDGRVGIGGANPSNGNTVNAYKMLTVNGDVSLANYNPSSNGNHMNGLTALEILGNNGIPTARGISVDNDPAGDLNFFVNSAQHGNNDQMAEFHFKDGSNPTNDLMKLNQGGELILPQLPGIGSYTGQLKTLLVDANGKLVPGSAVASTSSTSWNVGGNAGVGTTGFLGTIDAGADLILTAGASSNGNTTNPNGVERLRLLANGNIVLNNDNTIGSGNTTQLLLKTYGGANADIYHGVGYFQNYNGIDAGTPKTYSVDGPVLYGYSGGALVTKGGSAGAIMALQWDNLGHVHVGTEAPTYAPYSTALMTVSGVMVAKEIYVATADAHWADYVFKKDYKLMPLVEVEKYISKNQHLPNVPSAAEVETKGQNLGELQVKQMEKTEELYLYIIEMNRKLEKLEEQNKKLATELENLKNK